MFSGIIVGGWLACMYAYTVLASLGRTLNPARGTERIGIEAGLRRPNEPILISPQCNLSVAPSRDNAPVFYLSATFHAARELELGGQAPSE
jgi:hypothetical protein